MGKKQIVTRIPDSSVWVSFLEYVEKKHGKTHGVIGLELQNALLKFLDGSESIDIEALIEKHHDEVLKLQNKLSRQDKVIKVQRNDIVEFNGVVKSLREENIALVSEVKVLRKAQEDYNGLHNEYLKLQNVNDRLRNNYDHLQARFNKSQNDLNGLEREISDLRVVVAKIQKMSFFERVLNRLPSEVKQLTTKDYVHSKKE